MPVLTSRAQPFATVILSDLGGPRSRQRLVLADGFIPTWLCAFVRQAYADETIIAVAAGRARQASTTRVRAIICYPARELMPEIAYVYVEERLTYAKLSEPSAPFHVVRCSTLPERVRFVEVPPQSQSVTPDRRLRSV